jgi:hypothetical protein
MDMQQVRGLQHGDQVYWNDPDNGICSRLLKVRSVKELGDEGAVRIIEIDGGEIECFAHELGSPPPLAVLCDHFRTALEEIAYTNVCECSGPPELCNCPARHAAKALA